MQKEKLIVKKFFTLKDVEIELSKFNVFIGEQASGKSLIIKLLYFLREVLTAYLPHYPKDINEFTGYFYTRFNQIFNINNSQQGEIRYLLNDYQIVVDLKERRVIFSDTLQDLFNKSVIKLEKNGLYPTGSLKIFKPITENDTLLSTITQIPFDTLGAHTHFIPAGRVILYSLLNNFFNILGSQKININPVFIEFGKNYDRALAFVRSISNNPEKADKLFEELSIKILKGEYIPDKFGGYIKSKSFDTLLSDASSGQQEFLPVYIILRELLAFGKGSLYIEEPEAHLYPSSQKTITELLVYVMNVINSDGLYITTHSPYILTVLNNLIMANEVKDKQTDFEANLLVPFEDVRAYFIGDGKVHSLMDEEYRIIDAEKLDEVSNTINSEYSKMVDLL